MATFLSTNTISKTLIDDGEDLNDLEFEEFFENFEFSVSKIGNLG